MMTIREVEALASGGESDIIEFKRSTGQRSDAMRTICGMLNGRGGYVLFGVTDAGAIEGQEVSTRTMEDIAHELRKIDPQPALTPERVVLESGREVIVLVAPGNSGGPFTYDGRPNVRNGPLTAAMPHERYRQLLLERIHPLHRWETQPAHGFGIEDLDTREIVVTIEEAIRRSRLEDPGTRDPERLLRGLRLMHDGQLRNAAVILFARADRVLPHYPQCLLRLARFRGADKTEFIDHRREVGNAFDLLVRAQRFLMDHLPVAGRVVPNQMERVDEPLYPPVALREALANALCHRDYAMPGGSVGIAMYDDRLEITSTGRLPFGLTPRDLVTDHTSLPWNPLIASVFYLRGIIEQWGRGTLKIRSLAEQAGLVAPEFDERGGEVVVRFNPMRYVAPSRVSRPLSPLQQQILQVLAAIGSASIGEIHGQLASEVPRPTVKDNLQILRQLELVRMTGRGRGTRWNLA